MMKNELHNLYYGNVPGWERRRFRTEEHKAINRMIESEKHYFEEKMSLDDCQRFQALENLYTQAHGFDEVDAFCYGFKLAVKLMCSVFIDEDMK